LVAVKAALLKAKLAAVAKVSQAKAVAVAAAKRKQERDLLRAQLCSPLAHKKPLTRKQCAFVDKSIWVVYHVWF
jgi:hypothetical protein